MERNSPLIEYAVSAHQKGLILPDSFILDVDTFTENAEAILKEHYRLGSTMVILSRSFCNLSEIKDIATIQNKFKTGIRDIRSLEKEVAIHSNFFEENRKFVVRCVKEIIDNKRDFNSL